MSSLYRCFHFIHHIRWDVNEIMNADQNTESSQYTSTFAKLQTHEKTQVQERRKRKRKRTLFLRRKNRGSVVASRWQRAG